MIAVVVAHPDDELLGAYSILKHYDCYVIFVSNGSKPYPINANFSITRKLEAIRIHKQLGNKVIFLDYPDTELSRHIPDIKSDLEKIIKKEGIKIVFSQYRDFVPDHTAVYEAVKELRIKKIFFPTYTNRPADFIIKVNPMEKFRVILQYRSQLLYILLYSPSKVLQSCEAFIKPS